MICIMRKVLNMAIFRNLLIFFLSKMADLQKYVMCECEFY